ncbi:hypothetical protein SCNRRL3882_0164 [Streptomyces chartreusis NRRL 3882]|uniref:Uncharacterized protein n=1 Tax=Streptomyces chartreusis NRRL 3882 TaxID=1079985 RepID=A0A2N9B032_STRCX|nr:hypothetical protein SCNRRL3882_0164 [Streptomyces chartreusis NRRL 3882]
MSEYSTASPEALSAYMTLDELTDAATIPATEPEPPEIGHLLTEGSGLYVQSESKPDWPSGRRRSQEFLDCGSSSTARVTRSS